MIDCCNKKINYPSSIWLLMKDIWKFSHDLNIYISRHIYREGNRTADCLGKKGLNSLDSSVWLSNFSKEVTNINFHDYYGFFSNCVCKFFDG